MLTVFGELVYLRVLRFPRVFSLPVTWARVCLTTQLLSLFSMNHGIRGLGAEMWDMSGEPKQAVLV